jgi:hypothetical protein
MIGPLSGWIALALVPLAAVAAWVLRRFVRGAFVRRMRAHYLVGYAALLVALAHAGLSMGTTSGANATGIWLATLAIFALGSQALLGANLQSPGAFRIPLRRWHLTTFCVVAALAVGHVAFNSSIASQLAQSVGNRTIVENPLGLPFGVAQQRLGVLEKAPLAAHAVHGVRGGEVGGRPAATRIAE